MASLPPHCHHRSSHHHKISYPADLPSRRLTSTLPKTLIICKNSKNESAFEERKQVLVDYDNGKHEIRNLVNGLRKLDIPRRYQLRVEGERFQKDWTVTEVVQRILKLQRHGDVEALLNCWVGRFSRKNYPALMKELTQNGSIEHCVQVFDWMKNQRNYCARNDIYNMMIRLHARHNRIDQARGLFFEMQKWRCKPDVETYNALINAHGRAGQWRWAMNIMEDMLRAAVCIYILPLRS